MENTTAWIPATTGELWVIPVRGELCVYSFNVLFFFSEYFCVNKNVVYPLSAGLKDREIAGIKAIPNRNSPNYESKTLLPFSLFNSTD